MRVVRWEGVVEKEWWWIRGRGWRWRKGDGCLSRGWERRVDGGKLMRRERNERRVREGGGMVDGW